LGTYKRLPRGKERPHDEFKDWTVHTLVWLRKHWTTAIEVLALAAVVFAVIVGADYYSRHKAKSAAEKIYELGEEQTEAEEMLARLSEIADDYSRTFAGKRALMEEGDLLLKDGKGEEAIERFRVLADGSRNLPALRIAALHRLANAQLISGKPAEAAKTYRKAAADPHNEIALVSELLAAACLERAKDYEGAAELYRRIIEDAGEFDTMVRDKSEERLIWLIAKGYISG
jgi:tetratricopeptide (TPR) repeat protein